MGAISRGIKNAFRNSIRTFSITIILALSIAMALVMLLALKTVQSKITSVKSSIGNTITVSPAGMRGFEGSGTLLTTDNVNSIKSLPHVSSVISTLSSRLTTTGSESSGNMPGNESSTTYETSLSAPDMQRPADSNSSNDSERRTFANGQDVTGKTFSMPISVTGISDLSDYAAINASSFEITSGEKIDAASSSYVAMLGKSIAEKNSLSAGQTFTAYGQTITVKGIFDAGNTFANSGIIMPIATIQNLTDESGQINSILVKTDSVDSLSSVQTAIKSKLGDNVDVTTSEQSAESAITPLENIKTVSLYSLVGSLVAGSIIIFLTMIMIVRERRREIGVLKAIGSSNIKIVTQFMTESLVLTLMGGVIGMIAGFFLSNPVLNVLVSNSQSSTTSAAAGRGFGGGGAVIARFGQGLNSARNVLQNIHAVVGWDIILYGVLAAVVIAIIGSAIPAFLIAKVRPAEVMRTE